MARQYALNAEAAREANNGGKRITQTGKYVGKIVAAFYEINDNKTESMNIMFVSNQGQEAGPLTIYTHNAKGEELGGNKLVHAIMACCRVRSLTSVMAPVDLYDYNSQSMQKKQKEIYKELTDKPIGLVLREEEYEKQRSVGIGTRMVIFAPFEAATELMAAEILDQKTQPEQLGNVMAWISKNPVKKLKPNNGATNISHNAPPTNFDNFDDDIPF